MKTEDIVQLDMLRNLCKTIIQKSSVNEKTEDLLKLQAELDKLVKGDFRTDSAYGFSAELASSTMFNLGYELYTQHITSAPEIETVWNLIQLCASNPNSPIEAFSKVEEPLPSSTSTTPSSLSEISIEFIPAKRIKLNEDMDGASTSQAMSTDVTSEPSSAKCGRGKMSKKQVDFDDVQQQIKNLLRDNVELDEIYGFITANVTEIDNNFIRALTAAVVSSSINNRESLDDERFLLRIPMLKRYVHSNNQLQVQCLIAIQILIHRLEHPQGLMQNMLSILVTEKVISAESVMDWKNRNDVTEGKGAAVTYLQKFFETLKESHGSLGEEEN